MRLVGTAETGTGFAVGEYRQAQSVTDGRLLPPGRSYPAALKAIALPRIGAALKGNADLAYRAAVPACDRQALARLVRDAYSSGVIPAEALGSCSEVEVGAAAANYLGRFTEIAGLQAIRDCLRGCLPCPPRTAYSLLRNLVRGGAIEHDAVVPALTDSLSACRLLGDVLLAPVYEHDRHGALSIGIDPDTYDASAPDVVIERVFGSPIYDLSSLFDGLSAPGRDVVRGLLDFLCARSDGAIGECSYLAVDWLIDQVSCCLDELGASSAQELSSLSDEELDGVVGQHFHMDAQGFRALAASLADLPGYGDPTPSLLDPAEREALLSACEAAGGLEARVASIVRDLFAAIGTATVSFSDSHFDYPPLVVVFCPAPVASEVLDMLNNDGGDAECHARLPTGNGQALTSTLQALSRCMKALSDLDAISR